MLQAQSSVKLRHLFSRIGTGASSQVFAEKDLELSYNGRCALLSACHVLAGARKGTKVLIPAFHCPACVTPVLQAGLQPVYYRITRDLTVDWDDLLAKLDAEVAAVMIIHYFGIETDFGVLDAQRRNGLAIIEDWSHSFLHADPLRLAGQDTDFRIYSFWKTLPLQAGGALVRSAAWRATGTPVKQKRLPLGSELRLAKRLFEEALQASDLAWAKAIFSTIESLRLRLRLKGAPPQTVGSLAGNSGSLTPRQEVYSMPLIAERAMRRTDLAEVQRIRQRHYVHYARLFRDIPEIRLPFPDPGASACPWLFPLIVTDRERFSAYSRQQAELVPQTFGTVLHESLYHDKDARLTSDAAYLADHVVCLPIHQDLTTEVIEATGRKLLDFFVREAGKSA